MLFTALNIYNSMIATQKNKLQTHEELFIDIYKKAFPKAAAFIRKMGGGFEEAKDVFHDALVIYYEKKLEDNFVSESNEQAYILGICKHLWYKNYNKIKLNQTIDLTPELKLQEEPELKVSGDLLKFVELSGKKCLELLKAFYYDKLNMHELAQKFNFSGERSATAQKHKCIEKIRENIRSRALTKGDFYE